MPREHKFSFSRPLKRAVSHQGFDDYYWRDGLFSESDIFICSYPRSGNHFLRFLVLSAYLYKRFGYFPNDFSSMRGIPDLHRREVHLAITEPRIIKTHFPYDPRYRRIIHLVRDPRDVLISYYYFMRTADHPVAFMVPVQRKPNLDEFVSFMMDGAVWPCAMIYHHESFDSVCTSRNYLRVRYEDLVRQNHEEVARVLWATGLMLEESIIERLMEHVSFANMRKLHDPDSAAKGGVIPDRERVLRRGSIGNYRKELSPWSIQRIEQVFAPILEALRYDESPRGN